MSDCHPTLLDFGVQSVDGPHVRGVVRCPLSVPRGTPFMSANYPPPQAGGQNPFGPQPGSAPYGPPQGAPYGAPQGAPGTPGYAPGYNAPGGYPQPAAPYAAGYPQAARRPDNVGLGLVVGVLVAIVAALAYGGLLRALAKDDGSTVEFRYGALAVGALVGLAAGKAGGRNPAVPVVAALLAVGAVIFGELFGGALIASHVVSEAGGSLSVSDIFLHHFGDLWKSWKHDFDAMRVFFLIFAAIGAFGLAKRFGDN